MSPRAKQCDIETPNLAGQTFANLLTGKATRRSAPANDVKAEARPNLLVRRRRRLSRRDTH